MTQFNPMTPKMTDTEVETPTELSPEDEISLRRGIWGASLLTTAGFLFVITSFFIASIESWQDYFLVISPALLFVLGIVSLVLLRQKKILAGTWLIFLANLMLPLTQVTFQKRIGTAVFAYILFSSTLLIWRTLPLKLRRWSSSLVVLSLIYVFIPELADPAFRIVPARELISVIVISTILITISFLSRVAQEFWRSGSLRNKLLLVLGGIIVMLNIIPGAINIKNAQNNTDNDERIALNQLYVRFNDDVKISEEAAAMLSISLADRNDIKELYLSKDRAGLLDLLKPLFTTIQSQYNIRHLYIEDPNGVVYLRVHNPAKFGDNITYRRTATAALSTKDTVAGVEIGPSRLGIRGVSPLYYEGEFIGMLEVGLDYDQALIDDFKARTGAEYTMWITKEAATPAGLEPPPDAFESPLPDEIFFYASTFSAPYGISGDVYQRVLETGTPEFQTKVVNNIEYSVLISPIIGYGDHIIGIVEIANSREDVIASAQRTARTNIIISVLLLTIALTLTWFTARNLVTRPLTYLTEIAKSQARGNLNARANLDTNDELSELGNAFNSMTDELQRTLRGLEQRVDERTQDIELAAEIGRTVSRVSDLETMLVEASDLILEQFDLYYVQIYLTNDSKTKLILESGTGEVGQQLLTQHHSLNIDGASINGQAAQGKRSVVIPDTTVSTTFRQNPLLPETRGEMAIPLMAQNEVIGVLDMQSNKPYALATSNLATFEALAAQLSIAIQNANLVEETEQARAEVERQARRQIRTDWNDHMDGIHVAEKLGFSFEHNEVSPLTEDLPLSDSTEKNLLETPITWIGEELGSLIVELDDDENKEENEELVNIVARQISQQLENLRLLTNAERYLNEVEESNRRQTYEGWTAYIKSRDAGSLGYVYDKTKVVPKDSVEETPFDISFPLKASNTEVGKLAIEGLDHDDQESLTLANAVAQRLGDHIESLRLSEQTQSALTQSEKLFDASRSLTQATNLQELVSTTVTTLSIPAINRALLTTFDYDPKGEVEQLTTIGNWWNGTGHEVTPLGTRYSQEIVRLMPMFVSPTPVFFNDTFTDKRVDKTTMQLVKQLNLRAVAVLPLHIGLHQIGALILEAEEPYKFTQNETRLFVSLAPQIATLLENRRQFDRAKKQAEREAMLNAISQKIQSATTVEAVLQIAARELGHALGAPMTVAQLNIKDQE